MTKKVDSSSPKISPLLVMAIGVLAISTGSIFIRFAQTGAPSLVIATFRLGFSILILTPFALHSKRSELKNLEKTDIFLGLLSGIFLALHFATWITSLEYTSVASSVVFVNTSPIWVALISPIILKEHLSPRAWLGVGLASLGGFIVGLSDSCQWIAQTISCPSFAEFTQGRAFWGNFLALCGAWMLAGYLVVGRRLRAKMSLLGYIFVVYGIAALIMLLITLSLGMPLTGYTPTIYLWMLLLALIPQLLGHTSSNYALGYLPAAFVSVSLLGEPVGSTILAYFFLHETPSILTIIGGGLILFGIYLVSRK